MLKLVRYLLAIGALYAPVSLVWAADPVCVETGGRKICYSAAADRVTPQTFDLSMRGMCHVATDTGAVTEWTGTAYISSATCPGSAGGTTTTLIDGATATTSTSAAAASNGQGARVIGYATSGTYGATITVYGTNVDCGSSCSAASLGATSVGTITTDGGSVDDSNYLYHFALITAYTSGTISAKVVPTQAVYLWYGQAKVSAANPFPVSGLPFSFLFSSRPTGTLPPARLQTFPFLFLVVTYDFGIYHLLRPRQSRLCLSVVHAVIFQLDDFRPVVEFRPVRSQVSDAVVEGVIVS